MSKYIPLPPPHLKPKELRENEQPKRPNTCSTLESWESRDGKPVVINKIIVDEYDWLTAVMLLLGILAGVAIGYFCHAEIQTLLKSFE